MPRYVTYSEVKKYYKVGTETVRNWAKAGSIGYKTIQNAKRKTWLYDLESIGKIIGENNTKDTKDENEGRKVIYARVSSKKQEKDLERQIELLQSQYPDYEVIKDIASGLNFRRSGFTRLVAGICRQDINKVVVTYKDRLCRFGYELFEQLCEEFSCKIVVFNQPDEKSDDHETQELQEDLLDIVNVFVARRNGKRAGQAKKIKAQKAKENSAKWFEEDKTVSESESEDEPKENIRS